MADEELAQPLPLPPDATNMPPLPTTAEAPGLDQQQAQQAEAQPAAIPPPRPPGTSGLAQQAPTKGEIFRNMLGDFLYSAGKGLAAAGHGPEANARGAGAAITAIPELHMMQQQMEIQRQQAQGMAAYHQAQAAALGAGSETIQVPVFGPNGKVATNPDGSIQTQPILQKDVGKYFGQTGAAAIRAGASTANNTATNANRLQIGQLKVNLESGKVSKLVPVVVDGQGKYEAFNDQMKSLGVIDESVVPSLLPKSSSTIEYKTLDDGSIVKLPKTTTTGPVLPGNKGRFTGGGGGGTVASNPVMNAQGEPIKASGTAAKESKMVSWDEDGRQVAGSVSEARAKGIKDFTEIPGQEKRDITNARHAVTLMTKVGDPAKPETQGVLQLIDSLEKDGKLGILASRWNSFMTTGVGSAPGDDPRIVTLINKGMLSDTAAMLAHFGASGGRSPQMLQHFLDLANVKKMDAPTLKAGFMAIADYMKDRAQLSTNTGKAAGGLEKHGPNVYVEK